MLVGGDPGNCRNDRSQCQGNVQRSGVNLTGRFHPIASQVWRAPSKCGKCLETILIPQTEISSLGLLAMESRLQRGAAGSAR
jgi:hypothetical protein